MNYYPFHIGDYASHTRHLSLIEDLAYRRMLDLYYLKERPFNACPTSVARSIGMSDHASEVESVLEEFFDLEPHDGWRHTRAEAEIDRYRRKVQGASKAGLASAAQRSLNKRATNVQPTKNQEPLAMAKDQIMDSMDGSGVRTSLPEARTRTVPSTRTGKPVPPPWWADADFEVRP